MTQGENEAREFTARVQRFDPKVDDEPRWEEYLIPYQSGMTVLDVFNYISNEIDPTFAYRWSCRAGQCGSCAVVYNEMPYPACRRLVDPSSVSEFKPLPYLPVVRDMVVDTSRITDRLKTLRPYVEQLEKPQVPYTVAQDVIEPFREFRKCIECWSCIAACPAIMDASQDFAGPTLIRQLARLELDPRDGLDRVSMALKEGLYKCTACGNCRTVCDKNIDMLGKAIERLRSLAVAREIGPLPEHKPLTASIRNYWNPWQSPRSARARWAKKLDLPEKGETMFFAGCSPSLLLYDMSTAVVKLYEAIDEPLAYLGKKEHCCGSPLMRIGELDLFREMAEANLDEFKKAGAKRIVTTCAGCYKTLKNDYPKVFDNTGIEVVHAIEVAADAITKGILKVKHPDIKGKVTFHDPCHLGREGGVLDAPRVVMAALFGDDFTEMTRHGENSLCCGSGGGVKTAYPDQATNIGGERLRQALATGASTIYTDCPWCLQNLRDSASKHYIDVDIDDLIELLVNNLE